MTNEGSIAQERDALRDQLASAQAEVERLKDSAAAKEDQARAWMTIVRRLEEIDRETFHGEGTGTACALRTIAKQTSDLTASRQEVERLKQRLADEQAFIKAVLDRVDEACAADFSEIDPYDIADDAVKAGFYKLEKYDPEQHGFIQDAEPGSNVYIRQALAASLETAAPQPSEPAV